MKRGLLAYLTPTLALGLAGIAAVISILGMSKLFAGQALIVMIVMGFIESGKVIGTSILHNKWREKSYKLIKWPLLIMVLIAMGITSLGIYGFFTDAYQKTAGQLEVNQSEINLIENKKENFVRIIQNKEEQIELKNKQAEKLIDLRTQQEIRLDSLYNKNFYNSARETEKIIKETNEDLKTVQADVDSMYKEVTAFNDSITKLDIEIVNLRNNNEASAELGPLMYIAKVFNKEMDDVINFIMLFIMLVFDPLAIILVIVTNKMWEKKEKITLSADGIVMVQPNNKQVSQPLVEGKTKSNVKNQTNMPGYRQAPPPPPSKKKIDDIWEPVEEDDNSDLEFVKKIEKSVKKVEEKKEENKHIPKLEHDKNIIETAGETLKKDWQTLLRKKRKTGSNNGIQRLND